MSAQIFLVYGFIADPSLLVTEFHHVIRFNEHTVGIGVVVDSKPYDGFIPISPFDLDESEYDEAYKNVLNKIVAEVNELGGDLLSEAQRNMWERKLRFQKPSLFVGVCNNLICS